MHNSHGVTGEDREDELLCSRLSCVLGKWLFGTQSPIKCCYIKTGFVRGEGKKRLFLGFLSCSPHLSSSSSFVLTVGWGLCPGGWEAAAGAVADCRWMCCPCGSPGLELPSLDGRRMSNRRHNLNSSVLSAQHEQCANVPHSGVKLIFPSNLETF